MTTTMTVLNTSLQDTARRNEISKCPICKNDYIGSEVVFSKPPETMGLQSRVGDIGAPYNYPILLVEGDKEVSIQREKRMKYEIIPIIYEGDF